MVTVRATGFEAGDYLIAGPGWEGETPDGITDVLRSETRLAGTLTRTALFGSDDMANVRAIQHGYAIQPLSEYAGLRPPPPVPDPVFPQWDERRALSSGGSVGSDSYHARDQPSSRRSLSRRRYRASSS